MLSEGNDKAEEVARKSTRGVAVIALAKAYFLLTGFAQPLFLTRILGQAGYGVYGSVLNAVSILNNVVVAGSIQAMSKGVTESGGTALRRGLVLHAALGSVLAGLFAVLSGPIGVGLLGDPSLPPLLRIAAVVVGNYSVYAALVGALNGRQQFRAQATLDMVFATLRTTLVIGLSATAFGVTGAITGFAIASGVILVLALATVWRRVGRAPPSVAARAGEPWGRFVRRYLGFFAPVLVYQLALNMVLQADLLVLKALLVRRSVLSLDGVNELVGIYKSVQNFAFLPYQLLLAVTFVVFPIVSQATLQGDRETTRQFVRAVLRFSTLALGAMLSVLVALPAGVLRLAYRPEVSVGAVALRILSIGQGAFALVVISTTILLAAGRTVAATAVVSGMLGFVFLGDYVGVSLAPTGTSSLGGVAAGTAAGCVLGLVAVGLYVRRTYGTFVPAATLVRTVAATTVAAVTTAMVPLQGKVVTVGLSVVAVIVYVLALRASGEIGPDDRAAFGRILARRRSSPAVSG